MKNTKEQIIKRQPARHIAQAPVVAHNFKYTKIILIVAAILLLLWILNPLRVFSHKFVEKGDKYLADKKYISAELSYDEALILNKKDTKAKSGKALDDNAQSNVLEMQGFYEKNSRKSKLDDIALANEFPASENVALSNCKRLIDEGEYQLAIIPADTATQMAPEYVEAWIYLSTANLKTAQMVELSPEVKSQYMAKANDALAQARKLDPENKFVASIEKNMN